jgi:hypothetical protein
VEIASNTGPVQSCPVLYTYCTVRITRLAAAAGCLPPWPGPLKRQIPIASPESDNLTHPAVVCVLCVTQYEIANLAFSSLSSPPPRFPELCWTTTLGSALVLFSLFLLFLYYLLKLNHTYTSGPSSAAHPWPR